MKVKRKDDEYDENTSPLFTEPLFSAQMSRIWGPTPLTYLTGSGDNQWLVPPVTIEAHAHGDQLARGILTGAKMCGLKQGLRNMGDAAAAAATWGEEGDVVEKESSIEDVLDTDYKFGPSILWLDQINSYEENNCTVEIGKGYLDSVLTHEFLMQRHGQVVNCACGHNVDALKVAKQGVNLAKDLQSLFICSPSKIAMHRHCIRVLTPCTELSLHELLATRRNLREGLEEHARFLAACLVEAATFLHARNVLHRDVTPTNVFLDQRGYAKLANFHHAVCGAPGQYFKGYCGTLGYQAPEVVACLGHMHTLDYWGIGAVVYQFLFGFSPFADEDFGRLRSKTVLNPEFAITRLGNRFRHVSHHGQDAIKNMLCKYPHKRLGYRYQEANKIKWFHPYRWSSLARQQMPSPLLSFLDDELETTNSTSFHNQANSSASFHNQVNPSSSFHNQVNPSSSFHNQANSASSFNNHANSASSFNNHANSASSFNNHANSASSFNNHANSASSFNNHANSASSFNNHANSASSFNNQANSSLHYNIHANSSLSLNNQANSSAPFNNPPNSSLSYCNQANSSAPFNNQTNSSLTYSNQTNSSAPFNAQTKSSLPGNNQANSSSSFHNSGSVSLTSANGPAAGSFNSSATGFSSFHNPGAGFSSFHSPGTGTCTTFHSHGAGFSTSYSTPGVQSASNPEVQEAQGREVLPSVAMAPTVAWQQQTSPASSDANCSQAGGQTDENRATSFQKSSNKESRQTTVEESNRAVRYHTILIRTPLENAVKATEDQAPVCEKYLTETPEKEACGKTSGTNVITDSTESQIQQIHSAVSDHKAAKNADNFAKQQLQQQMLQSSVDEECDNKLDKVSDGSKTESVDATDMVSDASSTAFNEMPVPVALKTNGSHADQSGGQAVLIPAHVHPYGSNHQSGYGWNVDGKYMQQGQMMPVCTPMIFPQFATPPQWNPAEGDGINQHHQAAGQYANNQYANKGGMQTGLPNNAKYNSHSGMQNGIQLSYQNGAQNVHQNCAQNGDQNIKTESNASHDVVQDNKAGRIYFKTCLPPRFQHMTATSTQNGAQNIPPNSVQDGCQEEGQDGEGMNKGLLFYTQTAPRLPPRFFYRK